jgi:hypothetical protein
MAVVH